MESVNEIARQDASTEMLIHNLRQRIADFLQSIYSTVALLQRRLPRDSTLERLAVANIQYQAESYSKFLDDIHLFLSCSGPHGSQFKKNSVEECDSIHG